MGQFRYRLEKAFERVLQREGVAQRACAAVARKVAVELAAIAALDAATEATRVGASGRSGYALTFAERDRHVAALRAMRGRRAIRAECLARTLESKRAELAEATTCRAALERHRARKLSEHERAEELREANELDESNARATERERWDSNL